MFISVRYASILSKIRVLNHRKQQLILWFVSVLRMTRDDKGVPSE
jgi:hypothetical protein